jgi:hypothetical protein
VRANVRQNLASDEFEVVQVGEAGELQGDASDPREGEDFSMTQTEVRGFASETTLRDPCHIIRINARHHQVQLP